MPAETFATWLRRQLRRREWTQADLSRKSGLSQGRISDWLAGKRFPNPDSCDKLADALGQNVDYVLALAGHRPDTIDDEDPQTAALISLVRRVTWTKERHQYIRSLLEDMVSFDRDGGGR